MCVWLKAQVDTLTNDPDSDNIYMRTNNAIFISFLKYISVCFKQAKSHQSNSIIFSLIGRWIAPD